MYRRNRPVVKSTVASFWTCPLREPSRSRATLLDTPFLNSGTLLNNPQILEPTGQTGPTLSGDGLNKQGSVAYATVALICDAQSFPIPKKR